VKEIISWIKSWILWSIIFLYLPGCATYGDFSYLSPDFQNLCSRKIAILPVMNETVDMDAPKAFEASIVRRIEERGYRIIHGELVKTKLAERDIHYAEQVRSLSNEELAHILGVDVLLYTTVTKWRTLYLVAYASVGVGARFELVDSNTGKVIWQIEKEIEEKKMGTQEKEIRETALFAMFKKYNVLVEKLLDNIFKSLPYCKNN
jgi:hypothetical protein